jgi:hypothetical protein
VLARNMIVRGVRFFAEEAGAVLNVGFKEISMAV